MYKFTAKQLYTSFYTIKLQKHVHRNVDIRNVDIESTRIRYRTISS